MISTEKVKNDFGNAANTYDRYASLQQAVLQKGVALLEEYASSEGRLLDAGCGTGFLRQLLSNHYCYVGVDIAEAMCREAQGTVCASVTLLPFEDEVFNSVFSSLVLQWVPSISDALMECMRVTRPGGHMVLSLFGEDTLQELRAITPHVHNFIAEEELNECLMQCNWSIIHSEKKQHVLIYESLVALFTALKKIGATYKSTRHYKGLMTPYMMNTLEEAYRKTFPVNDGLPATWDVTHYVLKKNTVGE